MSLSRSARSTCAVLAFVLAFAVGCGADKHLDTAATDSATAASTAAEADAIVTTVREKMTELGLTAAVFGAWRGDRQIVLDALGESPVGVPATTDMQLRVGQPMESMLSTLLLQLDEEGVLGMDTPVARWVPDFPRADTITPRMLANSTSGIADYITDPEFLRRFEADPIRGWTAAELLALANARPPLFDPGTSWAYAHSDLVLLGEVIQKATGKPLGDLIEEHILTPLSMRSTSVVRTSQIADPILHGYTTERGVFEDSTFWNPTAFLHSGNMNATVGDVARWVRALAAGTLLTTPQHTAMMAPSTAGLGTLTPDKYFAFGTAHLAEWLFMNPSYGGYNGIALHDTTTATTIVVYTTLGPTTNPDTNTALPIGTAIATTLTPTHPPRIP